MGHAALRRVVDAFDREGRWPGLGVRMLRLLQLNEPEDLIEWMQAAGKEEVARLAVEVCAAAGEKDRLALEVMREMAESLARDAVACAGKLGRAGEGKVRFILAGGVLRHQPVFARRVARLIRARWGGAEVAMLARESAWGAVALAMRAGEGGEGGEGKAGGKGRGQRRGAIKEEACLPERFLAQFSQVTSPTEERNRRSKGLDRMPLPAAIRLMLMEEGQVPSALLAEAGKIARAIKWIVASLGAGGRLFYVGAGTSGRLGVLDASECPPTFRTPPGQVQGIIAGGPRAVWQAVEGAEDDFAGGGRAVAGRGVSRGDVVVGIAASGRPPFVWGALGQARALGARTVLLTFNPRLRVPAGMRPGLVIAPSIGPEVLTGSTRLKAGTATKLVLNLMTTLAMVQLGKVAGNLMIDLDPSNRKLRERAVRIVCELSGGGAEEARGALERSGWVVREALQLLGRGGGTL
jgi:N-acetylmuramic acid 6-phosphate etherase